jgi:hypothetical protein
MVMRLLKPLALVFFVCALITGGFLGFIILVLWQGYNEHNPSYKAAANVGF